MIASKANKVIFRLGGKPMTKSQCESFTFVYILSMCESCKLTAGKMIRKYPDRSLSLNPSYCRTTLIEEYHTNMLLV